MLRRIVSHAEFQTFVNADRSCRLPHFFVPLLPESEGTFAYGITIVNKVGNAVQRNKLKRRIKAWFNANSALLPLGIKINLIARTGAAELSWKDLCAEFEGLPKLLVRQAQDKRCQ